MMLRLLCLLLAPLACSASAEAVKYTSWDDVSWAITRKDKLAFPHHQQLYNDYMAACNRETRGQCQAGEDYRLRMNKDQPGGVYNFTETGFAKIRAPKALFDLINNFWIQNKGKETIEWKSVNSYHNMWTSPPHFVSMESAEFGGGDELQRQVWKEARKVLEEWTNQRLSPVSMYGVRVYKNDSILAPHVDRMPLVTSCIINLEQDLDEEWPLEVFDHQGNAHNVSMVPGDMVLYESHSVIHGRPFPMRGRAYVNVFLHFEPIGPLDDPEKAGPHADGLPPYVIAGGQWDREARKVGKWEVLDSVPRAINRGDVRALEYIAMNMPEKITMKDYNGWEPIHEAAYAGNLDALKLLVDNGASLWSQVGRPGDTPGPNVLGIAQLNDENKPDSPVMVYLKEQMVDSEL
ncbi:Ankyrin Repeat [Seminavis robusta]|uniref:Ankyrin Repeat n=1 Tax=Seminavis robusta TaxID=568900 RepID=A0A9N8DH83_9STRA|nr:Ankyrin Repeat [Seminavis robusta]|eukprot:Sro65_g036900.1 Ankyrin Repeat (405) ;mRNA; r:111007-112806